METRKLKVHLVGGDDAGWALDLDLRLTKEALAGVVDLVASPAEAEVLHSVNAEQLLIDPRVQAKSSDKMVVAHFTSIPTSLWEMVPGFYERSKRWVCVAQTKECEEVLRSLDVPVVRSVPYIGDLKTFFPVPKDDPRLVELRRELRLPEGKYIIGSFQRDTLGSDLTKFKPQKGPDVLMAALVGVKKRIGAEKIHVLIAGPRRHWLRRELDRHGISYTFDGQITEGDDYPKNILSLERINLLTNLIDLYVIASRWEGAPQAIFETIAAGKKIISTKIAVPREILPKDAIFTSVSEAAEIIVRDVQTGFLAGHLPENRRKIFERHSVDELSKHWKILYGEIAAMREHLSRGDADAKPALLKTVASLGGFGILAKPLSVLSKMQHRLSGRKSITLWGEMVDGPYGGGSQVLKALAVELERRGYQVHNNSLHDSHGHIMNSAFFDLNKARSVVRSSRNKPKVIHRIDGPIDLYRGNDRKADEKIFELNAELATATAYQCYYSWLESHRMGFRAVNPMIIRNACDPAFFHPVREKKLDPGRKIRIVSSSWSTNMRKGFDTYKYLDESLDFSKFEYRFIGRSPFEFKHIQMVDAVPSKELGEHLRQADVFITASLHDPASNSLLEAINCGLPVIYANSGGHAEIAGYTGLGFDQAAEVPALIERIVDDFESYRICSYSRTIAEIVDQYLAVLEL